MDVSAFDFDLPEECIALRPVAPRDRARLLVIEGASGALADKIVRDLPDLLRPGDVLVGNDTKVVPARLLGTRLRQGEAGAVHRAAVDLLLHTRLDAARWRAFARPAKRLKPGDAVEFGAVDGAMRLSAAVRAVAEGGQVDLAFSAAGEALDAALAEIGLLPLPPYIAGKRPPDAADRADYQTVFAREAGAIAAPTAGLHLTPELIGRLAARGIGFETLTLHVGPGTFLPVKAEDTRAHVMHAERGMLSAATAARLNAARAAGGRVVALGTTALRLLESAATPEGRIDAFDGETAIFITPGYRFRAVDGVMTNFHLPRSTLFMLVSAFCGLATMRAAYAHAIAAGYRFYSYGDASLLWPAPESLIAR